MQREAVKYRKGHGDAPGVEVLGRPGTRAGHSNFMELKERKPKKKSFYQIAHNRSYLIKKY